MEAEQRSAVVTNGLEVIRLSKPLRERCCRLAKFIPIVFAIS